MNRRLMARLETLRIGLATVGHAKASARISRLARRRSGLRLLARPVGTARRELAPWSEEDLATGDESAIHSVRARIEGLASLPPVAPLGRRTKGPWNASVSAPEPAPLPATAAPPPATRSGAPERVAAARGVGRPLWRPLRERASIDPGADKPTLAAAGRPSRWPTSAERTRPGSGASRNRPAVHGAGGEAEDEAAPDGSIDARSASEGRRSRGRAGVAPGRIAASLARTVQARAFRAEFAGPMTPSPSSGRAGPVLVEGRHPARLTRVNPRAEMPPASGRDGMVAIASRFMDAAPRAEPDRWRSSQTAPIGATNGSRRDPSGRDGSPSVGPDATETRRIERLIQTTFARTLSAPPVAGRAPDLRAVPISFARPIPTP